LCYAGCTTGESADANRRPRPHGAKHHIATTQKRGLRMESPTSTDGSGRHKGALARLARACALHPWHAIGVWIALLVLAVGASTMFGGRLVNEFTIPGSE